MSIPSTATAFAGTTASLSNVEFEIKTIQDQIFALTQEAQQAMGDQELLQKYHEQGTALEQQLKQLEMEYGALKTRLEGEEKMRKESVERGFKLNI